MKKGKRVMSLTVREKSVARKILSGVEVEDFFTGIYSPERKVHNVKKKGALFFRLKPKQKTSL